MNAITHDLNELSSCIYSCEAVVYVAGKHINRRGCEQYAWVPGYAKSLCAQPLPMLAMHNDTIPPGFPRVNDVYMFTI